VGVGKVPGHEGGRRIYLSLVGGRPASSFEMVALKVIYISTRSVYKINTGLSLVTDVHSCTVPSPGRLPHTSSIDEFIKLC
jgi:hypothetical protein